MRIQIHHRFHFCGPHFETRCVDHALQAIDDVKISLLVDTPQIAGAEKAFAFKFDERLGAGLGVFPVTLKHLRTVRNNFADFADRQFLQGVRIDDARIGIENRNAEALLLRPIDRVHVSRRHRFRQAITLDVSQLA